MAKKKQLSVVVTKERREEPLPPPAEEKGPSLVFQITRMILENQDKDLKGIKALVRDAGLAVKDSTIQAEFSMVRRCLNAAKAIGLVLVKA